MLESNVYRDYRATASISLPPVRIVHLGAGAFFRSHAAWFTHRANAGVAEPWGIAAFTGRSPRAAEQLDQQDGLYHLITRDGETSSSEVVGSVSAAYDGTDASAWRASMASADTSILTLTVTERGYRVTAAGELDALDLEVISDIDLLRSTLHARSSTMPVSAPGRIVDGLLSRRASGAGAIAILSCDNLPSNGEVTRAVVLAVARQVDPELGFWIEKNVSFPSCVVDRITPAVELAPVQFETGDQDLVPVLAEPHAEWIIVDDFPAGRPQWEVAGARFVHDVDAFEQRKLWMLNGAHTALATLGIPRGLATVAEAISDPYCSAKVESLWDDAERFIELPEGELKEYRETLRSRFANGGIEHRLAQIDKDAMTKIALRIIPILRLTALPGRDISTAAIAVVATWMTTVLAVSAVGTGNSPKILVDDVKDALAQLGASDLAGNDVVVEHILAGCSAAPVPHRVEEHVARP